MIRPGRLLRDKHGILWHEDCQFRETVLPSFILNALALLGGAGLIIVLVRTGIPAGLRAFGLHRPFHAPVRRLPGRRALVITTSHDQLGAGGAKTGVFASEMTAPYYTFLDAGMSVDVASIRGGAIPIEPMSLSWPVRSHHDGRYLKDPTFRARVAASLPVSELNGASYDAIFLAGGWGAAYDFEQSPDLGRLLLEADEAGAVIGGVCHGPLGLLAARRGDGQPLVRGRRMTAVTDKQVRELGVGHTPRHPERELRAAGAVYESRASFRDIFASHVVADGRLITGQNQNDGARTADMMMQVLLRPASQAGSE